MSRKVYSAGNAIWHEVQRQVYSFSKLRLLDDVDMRVSGVKDRDDHLTPSWKRP
jgi:hypothetical protein